MKVLPYVFIALLAITSVTAFQTIFNPFTGRFDYVLTTNESLLNTNSSTYWDGETSQADLNVNSSDFWDGLDTPSDINAGDITDDNTYILTSEESGLDVNSSVFWYGANTTDGKYLVVDGNTLGLNESVLNTTITALDTQKIADGVYLYNDSTIIYFNETRLNATITDIINTIPSLQNCNASGFCNTIAYLNYTNQNSFRVNGSITDGNGLNHIVLTGEEQKDTDYQHPLQSFFQLFIHNNSTALDEWIGLGHNGVNAIISVGKGLLFIDDDLTVSGDTTSQGDIIIGNSSATSWLNITYNGVNTTWSNNAQRTVFDTNNGVFTNDITVSDRVCFTDTCNAYLQYNGSCIISSNNAGACI